MAFSSVGSTFVVTSYCGDLQALLYKWLEKKTQFNSSCLFCAIAERRLMLHFMGKICIVEV